MSKLSILICYLLVYTHHKSLKITFKVFLNIASEVSTFKKYSILKNKNSSLAWQHLFLGDKTVLPSDLTKVSSNIHQPVSSLPNSEAVIKYRKKTFLFEITVTEGL